MCGGGLELPVALMITFISFSHPLFAPLLPHMGPTPPHGRAGAEVLLSFPVAGLRGLADAAPAYVCLWESPWCVSYCGLVYKKGLL